MSIKAEPEYISAGSNRSPKALDWGGAENRLIYAQCRSVAMLSDQEPFHIKCTFNKHTDVVNSVKWINYSTSTNSQLNKNELNEFVSASNDKTVIVWQGKDYQVINMNFRESQPQA
jgi:hypothetical protein